MLYFSKWVARAALVVSTMVVGAGASAQVTWSIADGKVTGAQNVNVGGSFYDVTFGDIYVPSAGFVDSTFLSLAHSALLDQVFISEAPLSLDQSPSSMRGCSDQYLCAVYILPASTTTNTTGSYAFFREYSYAINRDDLDTRHFDESKYYSTTGYSWDNPTDLTRFSSLTYSSWSISPVAAVPEPETYALMLAGLGLIGVIARRRKAKQA